MAELALASLKGFLSSRRRSSFASFTCYIPLEDDCIEQNEIEPRDTMLGVGKSHAHIDAVEKPAKRSWSLRKKLCLIVLVAIVVIGLAVGLGVGLTRGGGGGDDDGDDDEGNDGDDGQSNVPDEGPDRDNAWKPRVNDTWQIVLRYPVDMSSEDDVNPDVEVYDLDLYDNDIETFRILQDADKKVICYFSAGSWENWRDDKDDFDDADLGKELDGWEDERWVDVTSSGVRDIMKKRIELAWRKGCDAIDPDNVDGFVSFPILITLLFLS